MHFLTPKDLKERWHISTSTLKRIRRGGDLPCVDSEERIPGPGRHPLQFAWETVREWEQQHRAWLARMGLRKQKQSGHPCAEEQPSE